MTKSYKRAEVEALLQVGAIQSAEIVGTGDGMCIRFHTKGDSGVLLNERFPYNVKYYAKIDTAAKLLRELGIKKFTVDQSEWPE